MISPKTYIVFVVVLPVLGIIGGALNLTFFEHLWERHYNYFFPTILYKTTKLNMFGCLMLSIFIIITNYLYCIPAIIYWLLTVGRRKQ